LRLVVDDLPRADRTRIELNLPAAQMLCEIDPDAVTIVARNLIENALRHGSSAPISVMLSDDGWLHVENDCVAVSPQTRGIHCRAALYVVVMRVSASGLDLRSCKKLQNGRHLH
jgi:signal transduction histidine kinase